MNRKISIFVVGILSFLFAGLSTQAMPFPKDVMKWTEQDKQKQRDAGDELLKKLSKAIKSGKKSFNIPKGVYRFSKPPKERRPSHIKLLRVKNMTIEGNGSFFYFETFATGINIYMSENVTLRNLTLDWDPLPFTQGKVVSIDRKKNTFVFKADPGYEKLYDKLLTSSQIRGILFEQGTRKFKKGQRGFCLKVLKKLDDSSYEVKVRGFYGVKAKECGFEKGDSIVMLARMGRAIRTEVSGNILFENITLYSSPFVAYVESVGKGGNIYRNCSIAIRPGTNRMIGGNADGFNSSKTLKGPTLENCRIENIGDDFVNIHGTYYRIFEQKSPTVLIVQNFGSNGGKKQVLNFLENKTWNSLGSRKVVSKKSFQYTIPAKSKATARRWGGAMNYKPGQKLRAAEITLDKPVNITDVSIFSTNLSTGNNTVIKNCVFSGSLARGIRLQSENAVIENNVIDRCLGPGLTTGGQPGFWGESITSKNLIIKNNSFIDCAIGGDSRLPGAVLFNAPGTLGKAEAASDIVFTGNKIINSGEYGIYLNVCENVKITGNTFSGIGTTKPAKAKVLAPIAIKSAKDVKIKNNKVVKPGRYSSKSEVIHVK